MTVVEDIKQESTWLMLSVRTVKLKRTGKNYIGFCHFTAILARRHLSSSPIHNPGAALGNAMRAVICLAL
jgi:hypothetical protein